MTVLLPDTSSLVSRLCWVFDLDNTLYPPEARLFDQIQKRMTAYVAEALSLPLAEAGRLRRRYRAMYGTTLAGLMEEHGVDPDPFLVDVHDITLDHLAAAPDLRSAIAALPGRKIVYTNGSAPYAERVLAARGLAELFDAIYGVEHAEFQPKPRRAGFDRIFALDGLAPATAVMFEDDPRNLAVPHELGLATVHVATRAEEAPHVHFHTDDLTKFLSALPFRAGIV